MNRDPQRRMIGRGPEIPARGESQPVVSVAELGATDPRPTGTGYVKRKPDTGGRSRKATKRPGGKNPARAGINRPEKQPRR